MHMYISTHIYSLPGMSQCTKQTFSTVHIPLQNVHMELVLGLLKITLWQHPFKFKGSGGVVLSRPRH